jgi:hypothetical protein
MLGLERRLGADELSFVPGFTSCFFGSAFGGANHCFSPLIGSLMEKKDDRLSRSYRAKCSGLK